MSENNFLNALSGLQKTPQSNELLLRYLVTIRKDINLTKTKENINKLRKKGCLVYLVNALSGQEKHIFDISLSILGNCCMDKITARELVFKHNIFRVLNWILKRRPKEDSVNGRIFRIIGNICQHRDQWSTILIDKKPQIVTYVVVFVEKLSKDDEPSNEEISEATIIMAIRCLRNLLNSQTIITLVKTLGVLKAVGALFIKYSVKWQETKEFETILNNIIRLLQEYSRFKCYQSILEMRRTSRGDSLIHLSNVLLLAPKRVVKIVMNFLQMSQLQSELPVAEICDRFIDVLEKHSIITELNNECLEYLQCLCYLLEHPINRNHERCGKSLPLLIKVLNEFDKPSNTVMQCCILLIVSLNKCRYNEALMMDQLRNNIIDVLTDKIVWLVGSGKVSLKHKSDSKRKYGNDGQSSSVCCKRIGIKGEMLKQPQSPSSSDDEVDFLYYAKITRSPSSCSSDSDGNVLSWASPSSSPQSFYNDDRSDSDDYSPLCSEVDITDFPLQMPDTEESATEPDSSSYDVLETEEDKSTSEQSEPSLSTSVKVRLLIEITMLLKTYIKLKPPVPQLMSERLLMALLKSCGGFEWNHSPNVDTIDVICRILDCHDYLVPLMQTDFIDTIYELTEKQHEMCSKCSQFQHIGQTILKKLFYLAESGVGKGDIAHKLFKGPWEMKQKLVLGIPLIISTKSILGKLMLNCGGLDILMKLLREENQYRQRSIKVLCVMASKKLAIANPATHSTNLNRPKIVADKYKEPESSCKTITFKLDDESVINADKAFLTEKSDFFSRLLQGDFKESSEAIVKLHDVELKSLRCLLNLCLLIDKSESVEVDLDLETLLDVIGLSDRYLMVDLCMSLLDSVEQFRITSETVPTIYRWSIESGTNLLRVEAIAYALVSHIQDTERYGMFEALFNLGYSEQLVDDIQKLLVRYLTAYSEGKIVNK